MKSTSVLALILAIAPAARAEMIKPATLDLVCKSSDGFTVVLVASRASGAQLVLNGRQIIASDQLVGGTEGGDPYLQAVGNDYNFTLSGGDFEKAIYADSKIESGKASATILDFESNQSISLECEGLFSFGQK